MCLLLLEQLLLRGLAEHQKILPIKVGTKRLIKLPFLAPAHKQCSGPSWWYVCCACTFRMDFRRVGSFMCNSFLFSFLFYINTLHIKIIFKSVKTMKNGRKCTIVRMDLLKSPFKTHMISWVPAHSGLLWIYTNLGFTSALSPLLKHTQTFPYFSLLGSSRPMWITSFLYSLANAPVWF